MNINDVRAKIDSLDELILDAFIRRMQLSEEVAEIKQQAGLSLENKAREQQVLERVSERAGEYAPYAKQLFGTIIELSKARQVDLCPQLRKINGLLGQKLAHSFSELIHRELGNTGYRLYEREPDELDDFFKQGDIEALNVTIPYKKQVMRYCDKLSPQAEAIGCVNTIVRTPAGLVGHNTDALGFSYMARRAGFTFTGKKVLIFGSGGASLTAQYVAHAEGARSIVVISRTGEESYDRLDRHLDAEILVNTTPVGMYPERMGQSVVDVARFSECEGVLEVIYNPLRTTFLLQAEELQIPCVNGLAMLVAQAKAAEELFSGQKIADAETERICELLRTLKENIVIIGMPGSGKSTVGKALAKLTGREAIDLDEEIVQAAGESIPDIFRHRGEDAFRELESEQAAKYGAENGKIIITGGGIVKRAGNYAFLKQNGRIYCLERPLALLAREGRPLSQIPSVVSSSGGVPPLYETALVSEAERSSPEAHLEQMYTERLPLYRRFQDVTIENCGTPEQIALQIWQEICRCGT